MGGRAESVSYKRFFRKDMSKLTPQEKKALADTIKTIIESANHSLTIITLDGREALAGGGAGYTDNDPD